VKKNSNGDIAEELDQDTTNIQGWNSLPRNSVETEGEMLMR